MPSTNTPVRPTAGSAARGETEEVAILEVMPGLQSQVTFNNGGGGATIGVGPVDAAASKVEVIWNNAVVYSSLTPNQPGQSAIYVSIPAGIQVYVLKVKVWFVGWTRADVYTGSFTSNPGTFVEQVLGLSIAGGP